MCARQITSHARRRRSAFARLAGASISALLALLPSQAQARKPKAQGAAQNGALLVTVDIDPDKGHYVEVTLQDNVPRGSSSVLSMPAWTPGSYKIRDFARHIWELRATNDDGRELRVVRTDKQTWRVDHDGASYRVVYRLYCDELTVRTNYAQDDFAFLSPSAMVPYLPEERGRPYQLTIHTPEAWQHRIVLPRRDASYFARTYDHLADSPLLAGANLTTRSFRVGETNIDYVVQVPAGTTVSVDRLASDAESIVNAFAKIMGPLPQSEYAFLVILDEVGGGGLEHADSTALIMRPRSFADDEGYRGAARLAAHEFFHLWNVKRIRDRTLFPFEYAREVYSDLLWFHEGVTETMEARSVLHAGMIDADAFLRDLARSYSDYRRRAGSDKESLVQISRDAWINQYQPATSHRNETISYYHKGMLAGVSLDLEIRLRSGGRGSLEGLFRRLWSRRGQPLERLSRTANAPGQDARAQRKSRRASNRSLPAVANDEVWLTMDRLIALASEEAGVDMHEFFARYISGTDALPIPAQLEQLGIEVKSEPSKSAWSGILGSAKDISSIEAASPAANAGLLPLDRPIALDGREVNDVAELVRALDKTAPGSEHVVTFFRRQVLRTTKITVQAQGLPELTFVRKASDSAPASALRLRRDWLLEDAVPAATQP